MTTMACSSGKSAVNDSSSWSPQGQLLQRRVTNKQHPSPIPCPYEPGTPLMLKQGNSVLRATIKKTYKGGADFAFSNSCTVLLQINSGTSIERIDDEMVLKIMDWRFAGAPRRRHGCASWDSNRRNDYMKLPNDKRQEFERWLCGVVPDKHTAHKLLYEQCRQGRHLPHNPSCVDLYAYVISLCNEDDANEFYEAGMIPGIPSRAYREIFVRHYQLCQLSMERHIASIVSTYLPGRMPEIKGIWDVFDDTGGTPGENDSSDMFLISGLLMRKISGQPIPFHTSLLPKPDEAQLERIAIDLSIFELQLWRCNLQFIDENQHNFLVRYDEVENEYKISIVDYGAIIVINPDTSYASPISIQLHSKDKKEQSRLPQDFYSDFFHRDLEGGSAWMAVGHLAPDFGFQKASEFVKQFCPRLFREHKTGIDQFVWQTIILHIIHSYSQADFSSHGLQVYRTIRAARQIMEEELIKEDTLLWWIRAIRRIMRVINAHADAEMILSRLIDVADPLKKDYEGALALTLVHCLTTTQFTDVQPGLMFQNASLL